ncbi:6 7-dimethyl-8-ribityllumazine synthase [Bienertia sinuspersici]
MGNAMVVRTETTFFIHFAVVVRILVFLSIPKLLPIQNGFLELATEFALVFLFSLSIYNFVN